MKIKFLFLLIVLLNVKYFGQSELYINNKEYFEMPGLNVMVFHDYYPEGHQTGVTFIQNGERIVANGDVRLEPAPGQWSPVPKYGGRKIDRKNQEIIASLWYPDSSRDRKGFNPIEYPDLILKYKVRVKAAGQAVKVYVDLEKPLPKEWVGKVGFNLELFPGAVFGKTYLMDNQAGIFPPQPNGPMIKDTDGQFQLAPMAEGNKLVVAPESDELKIIIQSDQQKMYLLDGRGKHNNNWFVVRSLLSAGKTENALEWTITPNVIPNWKYKPVVQVSQIGYHPLQQKIGIIELDKNDKEILDASVVKFNSDGKQINVITEKPKQWGEFLRYKYLQLDFTKISEPGMYQIKYGISVSNPFQISNEVFDRHAWQPVLEYFLPVQMCHMRVNENYRVWHGLCHEDDALMAPTSITHFDGYFQGPSTLTRYKPFEHVPGLNVGGWHDAGDYDLRVESQSSESFILSLAYEEFNVQYDETTIDQKNKVVEIHQPDGVPDILQQIEHGALTVVNGYNALGRLYRGMISQYLRQYVLLGDGSIETDLRVYDPSLTDGKVEGNRSGVKDDRLVFTEENPFRELMVASDLAGVSRVLKDYNPELSKECLRISEELWKNTKNDQSFMRIAPAVELFLTTGKEEYKNSLIKNSDAIIKFIDRAGWFVGRALKAIDDKAFTEKIINAIKDYHAKVAKEEKQNPYGVPYQPNIWGAGWDIQEFGVGQYFLHKNFPDVFAPDYMLNALNFILGVHPGSNTASFASGVGVNSLTVAYGVNRADWSYIPGGVASGTALIRPDLPELKVWPYFWQQTEYVLGGGSSNYMFMVLAANKMFNKSGNASSQK